ncbi:MAG: MFS transporter [Myxococcota bacterium]
MNLRKKLSIVAWVYVIEGFPMGLYADIWPVYFRRQGISLTEIGILSGLSIAWSVKVLWSPLVDRFGDRRQWIAGALVTMSACLATLALTSASAPALALAPALAPAPAPAQTITPLIWLAVAIFCAASATQDIAIDAYTIGLVDRGEEGPTNSIRVGAYRIGLIAAGGGLMFLPRWIGWSGTFSVAAGMMALMSLSLAAVPKVPVPEESQRETWPALRRWLSQPGAWQVGAFVLLYRLGDRAMGPMVKPFWVDQGFSDESIASVSTTLGALATIVGALVGGGFVGRFGIGRGLWVLGAFALASNLAYAAAAASPEIGAIPVYAASVVESFCSGLATAAFLSFLMHVCEKEHAAVQYALLTSIYALAGSVVAASSGWFAQELGYAGFFALTAAFALPAFFFLPGARQWIKESSEGSTAAQTGTSAEP